MSEEELRRALSALERKLDDIRAEVVTALREFKQENKGSHAEFYRRISAIELECAARKHMIEDAVAHLREDVPAEEFFHRKVSSVAVFLAAQAAAVLVGAAVGAWFR